MGEKNGRGEEEEEWTGAKKNEVNKGMETQNIKKEKDGVEVESEITRGQQKIEEQMKEKTYLKLRRKSQIQISTKLNIFVIEVGSTVEIGSPLAVSHFTAELHFRLT